MIILQLLILFNLSSTCKTNKKTTIEQQQHINIRMVVYALEIIQIEHVL